MSRGLNKVMIIGHLGRDPEMRFTPSGQAVTNFNLAANRQFTDAGGQVVKETTWFRISVFGKAAENCNQYLQKGSLVLVEGRLVSDPETGGPRLYNRQDGTPGSSFEVSANTVRFLAGQENHDGESEPSAVDAGGADIQF